MNFKILYYSTAYHAHHGGSIQSIEFFKNIDGFEGVKKELFPSSENKRVSPSAKGKSLKNSLKKSGFFQVLSFYRRNSFYYKELVETIERIKPEVILFQIDSNFLQLEKIKKRFPTMVICAQINGSPFDEVYENIFLKEYFLKKQRASYRKTDLNFFISQASATQIMGEDFNESRDKIVCNGTDLKKFYPINEKGKLRKRMKYPQNDFIIGYVGTLDHHKKLIRLVEAVTSIKQIHPEILLVIIGDGPVTKELRDYIKTYNLPKTVELRGWVSHDQINEHLNCFDIAVHHYANHYMNPLKIFEYLAVGLPVIAPDIPSVRAIFRDNEDLIISDSENKNLKEAITRLIENKDLRKKLSSNEELLRKLASDYTWEAYTEKILKEIELKLSQLN